MNNLNYKLQIQESELNLNHPMSLIQNDPLRFLKPRKKQFHLTPNKSIPDSKQGSPRNSIQSVPIKQNIHKPSNKFQNVRMILKGNFSTFITKQLFNKLQKQHQLKASTNKSGQIKKFVYRPLKYLQHSVQIFLKSKTQAKLAFESNAITLNKEKNSIDRSNHDSIDRIVEQNQFYSTKKCPDKGQNAKNLSPFRINKGQIGVRNEKITYLILPQKYSNIKRNDSSFSELKQQSSHLNWKKNDDDEQNTQLNTQGFDGQYQKQSEIKQCMTCKRSFNVASYQKHIKVCEKVFFQKRKEFSSEKQRSLSKKK